MASLWGIIMVCKMTSLVNECLKQHEGGEKFFDAIDEKLRDDKTLINMMINKVLENEKFDYIIVSGKFGVVFKDYCNNYLDANFNKKIIVVNGGLRKDYDVISFWEDYNIKNKKIIFIDDSFYLGRTRDKIKNAVLENQGSLISTYVFYDGSKVKEDDVHSFYRYYDFHKVSE